jgi:sodium transport system permease protein
MERIRVIFSKEIRENLRDRRTLYGALLYPLIGPILVALLLTVIGRTMSGQAEKPLPLPVVGGENAPSLIQFLAQNGATIQSAPEDAEGSVRAGDHEVILIIPKTFDQDFRAGRPAAVRMVIDDSRQSAGVSVRRARSMLSAYSQQIGSLRLLARGINPAITSALAIEEVDVSTPQSKAAGSLLMILPYFIVLAAFIGGLHLAIDATVGERERGSLEPLLINPATRCELILGKLGATLIFSAAAVIETLLAFYVILNVLPTEALGVKVSMSINTLGLITLIAIPMMLLASALQMIIASFTRSIREAQNYLSYISIIPALPGMFLAFIPFKIKLWMMLIPIFGQQLLINQAMRGETLGIINPLTSALITFALGIVLTIIAVHLYERERILFGRFKQ